MFDLLSRHAIQVGQNVVIDTGGGKAITLNNVNIASLDTQISYSEWDWGFGGRNNLTAPPLADTGQK